MTLDDFKELCEKHNLHISRYNEQWYIANLQSKYISSTCSWIISYNSEEYTTMMPARISTDGEKIYYESYLHYSPSGFLDRLNLTYDIIKLIKMRQKIKDINDDFR